MERIDEIAKELRKRASAIWDYPLRDHEAVERANIYENIAECIEQTAPSKDLEYRT